MWETYQRLKSLSTVLRTYINNSSDPEDEEAKEEAPSSLHMINISGAVADLSHLVHEALHAKVGKGCEDLEEIFVLSLLTVLYLS